MKGVKLEHNHIYPVNDLIEHNTGVVDDDYSCACNPDYQYDWEDDFCIVVHDAMDGREISEESPAYLKNEYEK